ncbi:hypothetical protein ACQ643_005266, partial [Escherichia coli]
GTGLPVPSLRTPDICIAILNFSYEKTAAPDFRPVVMVMCYGGRASAHHQQFLPYCATAHPGCVFSWKEITQYPVLLHGNTHRNGHFLPPS